MVSFLVPKWCHFWSQNGVISDISERNRPKTGHFLTLLPEMTKKTGIFAPPWPPLAEMPIQRPLKCQKLDEMCRKCAFSAHFYQNPHIYRGLQTPECQKPCFYTISRPRGVPDPAGMYGPCHGGCVCLLVMPWRVHRGCHCGTVAPCHTPWQAP